MKALALLFAAVFFGAVIAGHLCFGQLLKRGDHVAPDAGIRRALSSRVLPQDLFAYEGR